MRLPGALCPSTPPRWTLERLTVHPRRRVRAGCRRRDRALGFALMLARTRALSSGLFGTITCESACLTLTSFGAAAECIRDLRFRRSSQRRWLRRHCVARLPEPVGETRVLRGAAPIWRELRTADFAVGVIVWHRPPAKVDVRSIPHSRVRRSSFERPHPAAAPHCWGRGVRCSFRVRRSGCRSSVTRACQKGQEVRRYVAFRVDPDDGRNPLTLPARRQPVRLQTCPNIAL